ncbi:unnamed protein product, partial [Brenthis ino]
MLVLLYLSFFTFYCGIVQAAELHSTKEVASNSTQSDSPDLKNGEPLNIGFIANLTQVLTNSNLLNQLLASLQPALVNVEIKLIEVEGNNVTTLGRSIN